MSWLTAPMEICQRQISNLKKIAAGLPCMTPPLGSMTLDKDDVRIARQRLQQRKRWYDPDVVTAYEQSFARWNGSQFAYAAMGGRVALSACIYALDLKPGDEVILPGYTCIVVQNAFHYAGIRTVYSDIELQTYGLDVNRIEEKITPGTKAILLHHLYGLVCRDYEAVLDLARRRCLRVIEDCAHATGASYKGVKVGNYGDVAFYSSEQSKVFNTIQGGMAVTSSDTFAARLRDYFDKAPYPDEDWIDKQLSNVIMNYYQFKHPHRCWMAEIAELQYGRKRLISTSSDEEQGIRPAYYGRKMPAAIAELGLNQLRKIDHYNKERCSTAKQWDTWCETRGYDKPVVIEDSVPVFLRYPVLVEPEKKSDRSWALKELGVEPGVWFSGNLHPVNIQIDGCPNADRAVRQCINFPTLLK